MIVEFYVKSDGSKPVADFLDSLPDKLAAKTARSIKVFEDKGFMLKKPYLEKIDGDIWELRTIQSTNITRVMFFFFDGEKAILTNGFVKKTDKTPSNEIQKAKEYRKDYYRRFKK